MGILFVNMIPTLLQLDPTVLKVLAVIMALLFIISLIKKAIKLGIFLLIVAMLFGCGVPALNNLRESYGMNYNQQTETVTVKVDGKEFSLPIKEIKASKDYSIKFEKGGSETKINLSYVRADGTGVSELGANAITIPNFMLSTVEQFLSDKGLKYTEEDASAVPVPTVTTTK